MKKLVLALLLLTFVAINGFSQTGSQLVIEGKVLSKSGESLVWVIIKAGKSGPGVVTNADGDYKLVLADKYADSSINFRTVGYEALEIKATELVRQKGQVKLQESVLTTSEVLVTPSNTGFKPLEDGKWQEAFYREYFVKDVAGDANGLPVEMLECDYWMQRTTPQRLRNNVYISKSRAREKFDNINYSSSYCLTDVWVEGNANLKLYHDSFSTKEPVKRITVTYEGELAVEEHYNAKSRVFEGPFIVTRLKSTGGVAQIVKKMVRRADAPEDRRKLFNPFKFYKGLLKYTLNITNQDYLIRYADGVPTFLSRNMKFKIKFDDPGMKVNDTYTFKALWTRTGEADNQPKQYSFKWEPGNPLFKQSIKKGEAFWELSNTILPTKLEEEYLKELSD